MMRSPSILALVLSLSVGPAAAQIPNWDTQADLRTLSVEAQMGLTLRVPFGPQTRSNRITDRAPSLSFGVGIGPDRNWRGSQGAVFAFGATPDGGFATLAGRPLDYGVYAQDEPREDGADKPRSVGKTALLSGGIILAGIGAVAVTGIVICGLDEDC